MTFRHLILSGLITLAACLAAPTVHAQQGSLPDAPEPMLATAMIEPASALVINNPQPVSAERPHAFWDAKNSALFAIVALTSTGDFIVTHDNLQSGGRELNPVVRVFGRSAPGLALNFGGETASVIGLSYFLHKTGHHKLERLLPLVNSAMSVGCMTYGITHR